jgi:hypothetical protein
VKTIGQIYVHTLNDNRDKDKLRKCKTAISVLKLLGVKDVHVYTDLKKYQIFEKHDMLQTEADRFEAMKKDLHDELQ